MNLECPACKTGPLEPDFRGSKFSLLKCPECGLVFTDPMPSDDDLVAYYQGYSFRREGERSLKRHLPAVRASLEHFVGRPTGGGRFLDYGGGYGLYAAAAEGLGWRPALFDYDKSMVEYGQRVLGIEQAHANLDDLTGRFEVIFAFHVVEHWNAIDRHLATLLELLEPGGRVVCATPNAKSAEKRVRHGFRRYYEDILRQSGADAGEAAEWLRRMDSVTCWDPPRHLLAFTPSSVEAIAERHRLQVTVWTGYNTDPLFEPRQYVVPRVHRLLPQLARAALRRPGKVLPHFLSSLRERRELEKLQQEAPGLGEQLYFQFTAPHSIHEK